MEESRKYLAERLFSEDKTVTYRILSRALKVHVNTAKGMLYDFHRWQNAMRAGTVHATYLLYGTKKADIVQGDGDVEMTSSAPEGDLLSEDVTSYSLALVPEEHLQDVLSSYEEVTSFQVYSLAPQPTKDLQLLSEVSRQLLDYSNEDPVEMATTYGSIVNPNMRRRERQGQRSKAVQPVSAVIKVDEKAAPTAKPMFPAKVKQEPTSTPAKEALPSASSGKKGTAPPALKRGGSSGIMSSFAKAAAKASKPGGSKPSTPSAVENKSADALSDDGEDDSEAVPLPLPKAGDGDTGRKSRKEREAELKRMMEEDDDDDDDGGDESDDKADVEADEPMEEAPEAVAEPEPEPEPAEVVTTTGDGRRRGKRRIMKKKQVMDDQGYLVTIQEPAWESFSEDEAPVPTKPKPSSVPSSSSQGSKTKKAPGKGAQGNIMSFFAKKG